MPAQQQGGRPRKNRKSAGNIRKGALPAPARGGPARARKPVRRIRRDRIAASRRERARIGEIALYEMHTLRAAERAGVVPGRLDQGRVPLDAEAGEARKTQGKPQSDHPAARAQIRRALRAPAPREGREQQRVRAEAEAPLRLQQAARERAGRVRRETVPKQPCSERTR